MKKVSKSATEPMEWMANDASTSCLICSKLWSMKNRYGLRLDYVVTCRRISHSPVCRRHHCRRCGRLVCNECSMRTMPFEEGEEPKRICDDCFESVTRKQQVQLEVNYHRERETQLLHATSKVSDSLVRVYFLDGSFKTVFYDESTTSTEIASKLCFSVKIALFEVEKDLRNPNEFVLVPLDECIVNIIARWSINGLSHAKLVIPISDMNSVLRTQVQDRRTAPLGANASTADHLAHAEREKELKEAQRCNYGPGFRGSFMSSVGEGFTNRESIMDSPNRSSKKMSIAGPNMDGMGGGDVMGAIQELHDVYAKLEAMSQDNIRLVKEIADVKKKYDILRTIHTKTNKNTRELKKEMDGLKGPEAGRGRSNSGEARPRMNSGVRSSFGLMGLTQSLSVRPQPAAAGISAPTTIADAEQPASVNSENYNESEDETAIIAPSMLYKGAMLRKSTGVTKLFKPTYAVFTEQTLSFYSDETMKKLDRSCLTKDAVAAVGSKEPSWFTISTQSEQIILKTESAETSELLVSVINEAKQTAQLEAESMARRAAQAHMTMTEAVASVTEERESNPTSAPPMEVIPEEEEIDDSPVPVKTDLLPPKPPLERISDQNIELGAEDESTEMSAASALNTKISSLEDGGMVHYRAPALRQGTGVSKKFKSNYIVFSDASLKFYADETMKKLEKSLPTKGSSAIVGPRDPLWLTITNGKSRYVLKFESVELPRKLEALVNGLANAANMEASMVPLDSTGTPPTVIVTSADGSGVVNSPVVYRRGNSFKEVDSEPMATPSVSAVTNKYEELKDIDSTYQVKVFLDKVAGIESFFRVFDDIMYTTLENGVRESQQVTHTYEIISAMQTLYAGILDYGENWTSVARDWLLRMLRQHMRLPVQEPEILMAVIQCISRENMMFSPDTSEVVNQIIEMSFEDISNDDDPDFPNSTEGVSG